MIQPTDINDLMKTVRVPIKELAQFLYNAGFRGETRFSTDDIKMFISNDGRYLLTISGRLGKIYSTQNQKKPLHIFSIVNS